MIHHVQLACPRGSEGALRAFFVGVLGLTEKPKPPALAARGGCWFTGDGLLGGGIELHLGVEDDFRPARKAHPNLPYSGAMADELPELIVVNAGAWRAWLDEHYEDPAGVWLVLAKKGTTTPTSLTYDQALEEALSYGWIDGQVRRIDETTYRQRFTPRRARSPWSKRNVAIAERLATECRMHAAGFAEVERAKADGRWDAAYAGQAGMAVPADLAAALAAESAARAMFDILTSQNRYAVLYRINEARGADTRARRIAKFVAMLARGETVYPQKRRLAE